jgi:hypothetical protein
MTDEMNEIEDVPIAVNGRTFQVPRLLGRPARITYDGIVELAKMAAGPLYTVTWRRHVDAHTMSSGEVVKGGELELAGGEVLNVAYTGGA